MSKIKSFLNFFRNKGRYGNENQLIDIVVNEQRPGIEL